MKTEVCTPVIFRKFKYDGSIIAIFPAMYYDDYYGRCGSYMRIGQHGCFDLEGLSELTTPAKEEEYKGLLEELESIGYNDLVIYKRVQEWMNLLREGYYL